MIHSKFFVPRKYEPVPPTVPKVSPTLRSSEPSVHLFTLGWRAQVSGDMLSVGHLLPGEEGPKPEAKEGELCILCFLSDVLFSRDTEFLFVHCLIYPCQCVCRNSSMDCLNQHFNSTMLTHLLNTVYQLWPFTHLLYLLSFLFSRSFAPEDVTNVILMYRTFCI